MKASSQAKSIPAEAPEFFSPQVSAARRFYLNLNPPKHASLAVVSGGCEQCAPDYEIHRPTFPFYSIEYVVRGRGLLKLQKHSHSLQTGCVFSYGPGVRQDIIADPADPPVKYFVDFSGLQSKEILRHCHLPPGSASQIFPPNEIQNLFDELIRCGQRGGSQGAELCARLLECLALKIAGARAPLAGTEALSFTTYQRCWQHIETHFQRLKTLRQIAQECHVDAAYMCRLFQRYSHQSPYQILMRLKMNLAAEWLQQPGSLVKQVSERAGFSDQFHFSRAFKSVFGVAPNMFRRLR
ncbi:MAG: AraC family transcriptional regulator [Verrucomicrobiota bacterium]|jgi:AraC-like DNA-binding protein/quercetin dioxygenase-like cupin family protein